MKTYVGMLVYLCPFLISSLVGGEWSASRPGRFTAEERAAVPTEYEGGWTPETVWTRWRRGKYPFSGDQVPVYARNVNTWRCELLLLVHRCEGKKAISFEREIGQPKYLKMEIVGNGKSRPYEMSSESRKFNRHNKFISLVLCLRIHKLNTAIHVYDKVPSLKHRVLFTLKLQHNHSLKYSDS
jgi:hypothetical protein